MLLEYDSHRQMEAYVRDLNHFYTEHPELWEVDYSWEGFQWIVPDDNQQSVIAFLRRDAKGKMIMVVCNFNPIERVDYQMGVPNPGTYKELLNSDDVKYGGGGVHNPAKRTRKKPLHGFDQSIQLTLPPLSTVYLAVPEAKAQPKKTAAKKTAAKKPAAKKPAATAAKTAKTTAAGTKQARKPAASKKAAPKEK